MAVIGKVAMEFQLVVQVGFAEHRQEQPAEQPRKDPNGEQKSFGTWLYPDIAAGLAQAAGRHDAVQMRVMLEVLPPSMQDSKEADLAAEVLRVRSHLEHRARCSSKQDVVDNGFVLEGYVGQAVRDSEDDVEIWNRQQLSLSFREPPLASAVLALGTVSIPTRVIRVALLVAFLAVLLMTTERRCAAILYGIQGASLISGSTDWMALDIGTAVAPDDIRNLKLRPQVLEGKRSRGLFTPAIRSVETCR